MTKFTLKINFLGVNFLFYEIYRNVVLTLKRKYVLLLLLGIGISNIGAWIYLIALNLKIFNQTQSSLSIALLYILSPIAMLVASLWAGSLVDRLNTRKMMIFLDCFRAICIAFIPTMNSLVNIYVLSFLVQLSNIIFITSSTVYITKLVPVNERQKFNSLKIFIQSCGAILGPVFAGFLFLFMNTNHTIYFNTFILLFSASIIYFLPNVKPSQTESAILSLKMIKKDFFTIVSYSQKNHFIFIIYCFFLGISIFMTAIDSIEAAFSKSIIHLTDSEYGFLLSIFGTGILLGSTINTLFAKQLSLSFLIGIGTLMTSIGYIGYYSSFSFLHVVISMLFIGFCIPFSQTGFITFYQNNIPTNILGRFQSIVGIVEAIGIIIVTLTIGYLSNQFSIRLVGIISSSLFGLFSLSLLYIIYSKKKSLT